MKKIAIALITILLLGIVSITYARYNNTCPFDGNRGIWTGEIEIIDAHIYNVYQCVRGHHYLVKP